MRITKRQLRRIIREEQHRLSEAGQMLGQPTTVMDPTTGKWGPEKPSKNAESKDTAAWFDFISDVIRTELGDMGSDVSTEGSNIADALADIRHAIKDEYRGPGYYR